MITRLGLSSCIAVLLVSACAPGEDPNRLSLWADMEPAEQQIAERHVEKFKENHPGLGVELIYLDTEELRNQFQTAALANTGPELVYGPADQVGPFSIMGLIEPLEGIVPADTLAIYHSNAKPTFQGQVYALADQMGNHLMLGLNRGLVRTVPLNSEDWIAAARELTKDLDGDGRVDQYGIVMNIREPFWLVPWLGAFGGWVMDEFGDPTLDTPAMAQALRFFLRLIDEGVIPEGCDYQLAETLFKEGKAAFIVNGPWAWSSYRDAGIDVGLGVLPPVEGGGFPQPMTACKAYSIREGLSPEKRALAIEFLEYMTSARTVGAVSAGLGALPSRLDVGEWPSVISDDTVQASWAQLVKGRLMPVVPEMRVIWDVMRTAFQQVQGGSMEASEAGGWMQRQAERKIAEMRL